MRVSFFFDSGFANLYNEDYGSVSLVFVQVR